MTTVSIQGMDKYYGAYHAVRALDLEIPSGQFVTLLGPSGSGKTTVLRCVAGLENPDGGQISLDGRVVAAPERRVLVPPDKRRIGMVFQNYALWPHMTVAQNVGYGLRVRRVPAAQRRERVDALLRQVELGELADRKGSALSGGQQQRVALARALANDSSLVLFDEPLSNLDSSLRATTRDVIRELHQRNGATSIYVTHDQYEALAMSDRVLVLRNGIIEQDADPETLYRYPANAFVAEFLGVENLFGATVTNRIASDRCVVQVPALGAVEVRDENSAVGEVVTLAVRAADIRTGAGLVAEQGSLVKGQVSRVTFAGDRWEIALTVGDETVRATAPAAGSVPATGEHMSFQIPLDRAVVLPESPATTTKTGALV